MSEAIELFLSIAKSDINKIDFVEVLFKTKSGYGYHLRSSHNGTAYYYHMKLNQTLNVGDEYLIVFQKSKRVLDRLDVVSAINVLSFDNLPKVLRTSENVKSLLTHYFFNVPLFKLWMKSKLLEDMPTTATSLNTFLKSLPLIFIDAIIDDIPLSLLPDCLEWKVSSVNIRKYLIVYYDNNAVEINERIKSYCDEIDDQENLFFIDLLANKATKVSLSVSQVVMLFKALLDSDKTDDDIGQLIFNNPLICKELYNLLGTENEFNNIVFDRLLKEIPDTENKVSGYIEGLSELIIIQLSELVVLPLIPAFLTYHINEKRLCEYLVECNAQVDVNQLSGYITKHQYCHAQLLLNIIKLTYEGCSFVPNLIVDQIKEYQQALFIKNSNTRTKIDPFILTTCPVLSHKYLKTQTCCEGHLYYSKKKDQWGVKCRTNICDVIYNDICGFSEDNRFNNALFYKLINKLHGVSAAQLHQQESFTRSVAALNRWNDILGRLHCNDCNNPLALSEHAKNSMGKMAIGATYWHCNDKTCKQFCHSIKLSYCLGCNKVIDSRIDKQSCKPFEIKSFKKFYICSSCSSCCREHNGFSGRCGHCGKSNAYIKDGKGSYSPKATCQFCGERVSINYRSFDKLTKLNSNALNRNDDNYKFVYSASLLGGDTAELVEFVLPWLGKTLYVYDLFANLQNKNITFSMLSEFDYVYDVKILERIVDLGLFHNNYESTPTPETSFAGIFNSIVDEQTALNAQFSFQQRITYLINTMNEQTLWAHYEQVEMPFLYALHDLLGDGIKIDVNEVTQLLQKTEVSRNVLVEGLRSRGVETPDHATFAAYIQRAYPDQDIPSVMKAIERTDFKILKEVNVEFSAMHKISKLDRMGSLFKQIGHFQSAFIPDYQIMGAETGRCTSKSPNLLGFPKELRSIIKAKAGHGIVECDYSQMEIGVMAAMSDDEIMIADYNSGDVYQTLATALGLTRERAKLVFLSILYGVGITTLANWLQLNTTEAKQLVEKFFRRYHKVKEFQEWLVAHGNQNGYVQAVSGLRRRANYNVMQGANNQKKQVLQHWQNNWFKNFPIQASAAIIFKKAIITLAENNRGGFKLIAPMYDAIIFEAPLTDLDRHTQAVEAAMIRAMREQFPKLIPHIKINNYDVSCWNAGKDIQGHEQFFSEIIE